MHINLKRRDLNPFTPVRSLAQTEVVAAESQQQLCFYVFNCTAAVQRIQLLESTVHGVKVTYFQ